MASPAEVMSEAARTFYTVTQRLDRLDHDLRDVRNEVAALRHDHSEVKTRVAVIEKAQEKIDLQIELAITKAVTKLQMEYLQSQVPPRPSSPPSLLSGQEM